MKKAFSTSWTGSKQPRKQRKYRENVPLHLAHALASVHLSKDLRKKYGRRNVTVRKNDVVKVMRGSYADKEGKVTRVDLKAQRIYLEGIQRSKKDGSKVFVSFDPSKLMIKELALEDKERIASLEKKGGKNAS